MFALAFHSFSYTRLTTPAVATGAGPKGRPPSSAGVVDLRVELVWAYFCSLPPHCELGLNVGRGFKVVRSVWIRVLRWAGL